MFEGGELNFKYSYMTKSCIWGNYKLGPIVIDFQFNCHSIV